MGSIRGMAVMALVGSIAATFATTAYGTIRSQTGMIVVLSVPSTTGNIPEVVDIVLDQPLAATACPAGTRGFEFDSNSVTDANTRKNMVSMLLGAKLSTVAVTILYDDAGTHCSTHGFTVPYSIELD